MSICVCSLPCIPPHASVCIRLRCLFGRKAGEESVSKTHAWRLDDSKQHVVMPSGSQRVVFANLFGMSEGWAEHGLR